MTKLYEGMFLLDNQAVRADWNRSKAAVLDALAKHGAKVKTARRWDERRLAYPIRGRRRGTYLLVYFEQEGPGSLSVRRELDIEERVLRYLMQDVEVIPEGELEKSQAELADGFVIPLPPGDDETPSEAADAAPSEEAETASVEEPAEDAAETEEEGD